MRARNIKPDFFKNEDLAECDPLARLLFIGLWCMADKEGFIEYRPKKIGAELLPYESRNIEKFLEQLGTRLFIIIWCTKNFENEKVPRFIQIPNFLKHQNPHKNEKPSEIKPLFENPEISRNFVKLHEIYQTAPADSGFLIPDSGFLIEEECSELGTTSEPPPGPPEKPVVEIPLIKKDGTYPVYEKDISNWQIDFPGIDVLQSLRACRQWNLSNPIRRKTKSGALRHITSWLTRDQNRARGPSVNGKGPLSEIEQEIIDEWNSKNSSPS